MGRRALPPPRRGSRRGARARHRPPRRARRSARRDREGSPRPLAQLEGALRPTPRARARAFVEAAGDRRGNRAAQAPDRRARRHADRADRREPAPGRGHERQRRRRGRARGGGGRGGRARARRRGDRERRGADVRGRGSRRRPPLPLPPPHRIRQDDRRRRLRRGRAHARDPDPHPPPPARQPVPERPDDGGLRRPLHGRDRAGPDAAAAEPDHDPDLRVVRAPCRLALARRVPARDLRRGPHGARREDERGDPQLLRPALHRHDRDRAADREAGLRRLPGLGRRPAADRRRPPRPDRAAPLSPRATGRGDQRGADRRRGLRGTRAGRGTRPPGAQPGRRESLPGPLRLDARDRLRRRRRPRLQPRAGVPRGRPEGGGGLRPHAAGEARRDPRRLRARRTQRPDQRDAARGRLELAARDRRDAPRADGVEARLPAADRPDHADAPAQGGRDRRGLHAEVGHAQRARRLAPLAARRRLLPRGRPRHARAPPPRPAPSPPPSLAGAVARPGHRRRRAPARRDPARVAADRPEVPGRGRAALLGDDRRPADPLRPAGRVREEVRRGACLETRARDLPLGLRRREPQPAPPDDGAPGPRLDDRRARRLRRPRHPRRAGAALGEGPRRGRPGAAARDRRGQGERAGPDPAAVDVAAREGDAEGAGPARERGVPRGEAPARRSRQLARPPARGERAEADSGREGATARRRRRAARLLRGLHAARLERARPRARGARRDQGDRERARRQPARAQGSVAQVAAAQAEEEDRRAQDRTQGQAQPAAEGSSNGVVADGSEQPAAPRKRRRRRRKPAGASSEAQTAETPAATAEPPAAD